MQAAVAAYMQYLLTLTPAQLAVLANQMAPPQQQQQPVRRTCCSSVVSGAARAAPYAYFDNSPSSLIKAPGDGGLMTRCYDVNVTGNVTVLVLPGLHAQTASVGIDALASPVRQGKIMTFPVQVAPAQPPWMAAFQQQQQQQQQLAPPADALGASMPAWWQQLAQQGQPAQPQMQQVSLRPAFEPMLDETSVTCR